MEREDLWAQILWLRAMGARHVHVLWVPCHLGARGIDEALSGLAFIVIRSWGLQCVEETWEYCPSLKRLFQHRMGQKVFCLSSKGLHIGCPKYSTGMLISA